MGERLGGARSAGAGTPVGWLRGHRFDLLTLAAFLIGRVLATALLVQASWQVEPGQVEPGAVASGQVGAGQGASGGGYWAMAGRWDGGWYREIATQGYPAGLPDVVDGRPAWSAWAFLPLYPALVRLVMAIGALPFEVAATVVSVAAGCVAAVLIGRLLRDQVGDWRGLAATCVAFAAPAAPVLQVAYTESLGLALLAGFLLAVVRRRYRSAAAAALLLAVTRPIALPLLAVAVTAAATEWRRGRMRDAGVRLSLLLLLGACVVAGVAWPAIVWAGTGRADGYAVVGSAWWPDGAVRPFAFWPVLAGITPEPYAPLMLLTGAPLVPLAALLALGPWARRLAPPLRVWCVAYAAFLTATVQVSPSVWRYLLAFLPIPAVLVGAGWGRRGRPEARVPLPWVVALAAVWVVLGASGQVVWVRFLYAGSGFTP